MFYAIKPQKSGRLMGFLRSEFGAQKEKNALFFNFSRPFRGLFAAVLRALS